MPWTSEDSAKHKSGLTPPQAKKWAKIANETLKGCMKDGEKQGTCEAKAIKIANVMCVKTKRMM
jgi:hypothetical protein